MLIVNLKGGLGNQMFQYACGRALSLRNGEDLKLNIFGLEKANLAGDVYRPYSLSHFDIKADIATQEDVRKVANPFGIFSKIIRYVKAKFIYYFYVHFVPGIMTKRGNIYLDGFFQSEKYFIDHEKELREDFKPKEVSDKAKEWIRRTENKNSVSIHIRRKDYVNHKTLGGIATKEYYENAIQKLKKLVVEPHFFVFSDDVGWVRGNLDLPSSSEFVSSEEMKDYEELIIMSSCKHNIIANSSFSWWAAWLNANSEKLVFAPAKWAHGAEGEKQTKDILPPSWIRIEIK